MTPCCQEFSGELRLWLRCLKVVQQCSLTRLRRWTAAIATTAGLLGTGWMVWVASMVPRLDGRTLGELALEVVAYALIAWAWSGAIMLGLYSTMPSPLRQDAFRTALRTAA